MVAVGVVSEVTASRSHVKLVLEALQPLRGSSWLATDIATRVTWTIEAESVKRVSGQYQGLATRAFGLVTVYSASGSPVFLIEEDDTLEWVEPERVLRIREMGRASCEIVLERIEDAPS